MPDKLGRHREGGRQRPDGAAHAVGRSGPDRNLERCHQHAVAAAGRRRKTILNDDEAAEFAADLAHDLTRDRRDGGAEVDVNRAYNDHWMDSRRLKITADNARR